MVNTLQDSINSQLQGSVERALRYTPKQINTGSDGLAGNLVGALAEGQRLINSRPANPGFDDVTVTPEERTNPTTYVAGSNINPDNLPTDFVNRLAKLEAGDRGYTAVNEGSGAYGRYQFIPETAKYYAAKLGFAGDSWKLPKNQDAMFAAFTADNIRQLQRLGMPTDAFHVYGAHQQGAKGFSDIMGGNITPERERSMRANLPSALRGLGGMQLRNAWINHWSNAIGS